MNRCVSTLFVGLLSLSGTGCGGFVVDVPWMRTYGPSYLRGKTLVITNSVSPEVALVVEVDGIEYRPHNWKTPAQGAFRIGYGQSFPIIVESHFYDRGSDRSVIVKGVDPTGGF